MRIKIYIINSTQMITIKKIETAVNGKLEDVMYKIESTTSDDYKNWRVLLDEETFEELKKEIIKH